MESGNIFVVIRTEGVLKEGDMFSFLSKEGDFIVAEKKKW